MIELNEEVTEEVTGSVEETTDENTEQPVEEVVEEPIDESKFDSAGDDSVTKIDLSKPPTVPKEEEVTKVKIVDQPKVEESTEKPIEDLPVIEEITEDNQEDTQNVIEEPTVEKVESPMSLPENVQKLVDFMDETGGDINDYVNLNRDVEKMDDSDVLDEYYKTTKSHLTPEERSFLLEETYGVNEDTDDDRTARMKKIALKEQVAEARAYLDRQKSKYYEDIKAGSKLTDEQKAAIDFFNKSEEQKKKFEASKKTFLTKTDNLFSKEFKGFEYNVGDKKYRFNVKDADKVKTSQSDINNFVKKFTNKETSNLEDAEGYHKSLFTAMNADTIAKHFYDQGKADAIKDQVAKDKNIDLNPRKTHGEYETGGVKVRVLGDSSSELKNRSFKIRKKS
tara:strand:+ start:2988 stop:4169 length:1182 start_codon:yes stop_codon:yes gene_type:complete